MITSRHIAPLLGLLVAAAITLGSTSARAESIGELYEESFTYEAKGEYVKALGSMKEILKKAPKDYTATLRKGWLQYLAGTYTEAIATYDKASALAPKAVEPKLGAMLPLMAAKSWKKAEAIGLELEKTMGSNYTVLSRLAYIYYQTGQYPKAKTYYEKVLALYPSETEMMIGLGWTLKKMGDDTNAKPLFEKVLSIHRQEVRAKSGLE